MSEFPALAGTKIGILGAGYIGRHLARFLEDASATKSMRVELFDRASAPRIYSSEFDYVVHAAGNTGNFRSDPLKTVDSNVALTSELLQRLRVRRGLLLLSSTRVYGFSSSVHAHAEDAPTPLHHLSLDFLYDGSKLMMESMAHHAKNLVPYPVRVARLSNVYERFTDPSDQSTLIKKMMAYASRGERLAIGDSGASSKDYIHIQDALQGLTRLLTYDGPEVLFNIASGESASLESMAHHLGLAVDFDPNAVAHHCSISIEKARRLLQFKPLRPLASGLTS